MRVWEGVCTTNTAPPVHHIHRAAPRRDPAPSLQHNVAFQGRFWRDTWKELGLPPSSMAKFEFEDGYPKVFDEGSPADEAGRLADLVSRRRCCCQGAAAAGVAGRLFTTQAARKLASFL